MKKTIIVIIVGLIIAGIFFYLGAKSSVTGNIVNTDSEKIVSSEPKEDNLLQQSNIISEVDYRISVKDELTSKPLENAFVYLDGTFIGKTSKQGDIVLEKVKMGKHSLRADYKGESNILTEEVSNTNTYTTILINAPRTVTLELKDSETNRPINDVKVFLETTNGKAHYSPLSTDDEGKTQFNDILSGDYQVRIEEFPNAKPSKLVKINENDFITVNLDMPNPKFEGSSIHCEETHYLIGDNYGICTVTLKNNGNMESKATSVILNVYKYDNGEYTKIDSNTLDFDNIPQGKSKSLSSVIFKTFSRSYEEYAVAVIYDGHKYTPEDKSQIGGVTMPQGLLDKFQTETVEWCSNDIQRCGETIAGVAKAVVGIIGMV